MKKINTLAVAMALVLGGTQAALANTARLQVIHNAADPAANVVDVYVNGSLLLDEFAFRTATPIVTVPAGVPLNIGIAPGGASTPADIIKTIPVTLTAGRSYVAVANGVLDPSGFAANPDGKDIGFTLFARDGLRAKSYWWKTVSLMAFHGATDAPAVDIVLRNPATGGSQTISNLGYGQFSSYVSALAWKYVVDVKPTGSAAVVASFDADLSGLGGGAAVVFASGFLAPSANSAAFGLFAALPDGRVVALPAQQQTARLQVVHNAADPAASVVDVYVNDALLLNDFAFRTATPFTDVPAGVNLKIGVAPGNSDESADALAEFNVTLAAGKSYVVFANGVLDPSGFAGNPSGSSIGFSLFPTDRILEDNPLDYFVGITAFHGATDAPAVDIRVPAWWGSWKIIGDLAYGEYSATKLLLPRKYVLNVTPAGSTTVVASFVADLGGLAGGNAVVFASGFLNPAANQDGAAFGLYAVLPNGTVVALPPAVASNDLLAGTPALAAPSELGQNYPNPFNPRTTIRFSLAETARAKVEVFNARGQLVETLLDREMSAGSHSIDFNAQGLASGVYFYRLTAGGFTDTRRMVLLK
jgi:hypothetical protein